MKNTIAWILAILMTTALVAVIWLIGGALIIRNLGGVNE